MTNEDFKKKLEALGEELAKELNEQANKRFYSDKFFYLKYYNGEHYVKIGHITLLYKTGYYYFRVSKSTRFEKQKKEFFAPPQPEKIHESLNILTLEHYKGVFDYYAEKLIELREKAHAEELQI